MLSLVACLSLLRGKGDGSVISRVPPVTAGWSCVSASSNPLPSFFKQAHVDLRVLHTRELPTFCLRNQIIHT